MKQKENIYNDLQKKHMEEERKRFLEKRKKDKLNLTFRGEREVNSTKDA